MWYVTFVSFLVSVVMGVLAFAGTRGQGADLAELVCYIAATVGVMTLLAGVIRRPPTDDASHGLFGY